MFSISRMNGVKKTMAILLILLGWCGSLPGQDLYVDGTSPYFGWGGYNTGRGDAFCMLANKAALASTGAAAAGLSGERAYGLAAISRYRLSVVIPVKTGGFGFQAGYAGAGRFRESLVAAGYARKLGTPLDLGVQLGYQRSGVEGYPQTSQVSAEVGLLMHLSTHLNAGWNIRLPRQLQGSDGAAALPFLYSMGVGFDPGGNWSAAIELEKRPSAGITGGVGCTYHPVERIECRFGLRTGTSPIWFGCGLWLHGLRIDVAASVHERLGITPAIALHHTWGRKK